MKSKKIIFSTAVFGIMLFGLALDAQAQQTTTCSSLGGICRLVTLCNQSTNTINSSATDCGTDVCCVPKAPATGVTCSGSQSGTCRASCISGESAVSGSYIDCVSGNNTCCVAGSTPPAGTTTPPAAGGATADPSCPAGTPAGTVCFPNPIKASTMSEFLGNVLSALLGVVAFISLIFIIIGAVMYMLSAGNEQAIERAKKTITGAVAGLAIAAAAPTFLKTVKDILGGANGANADDIVNRAFTLKDIAVNVLNFLLSVTGIVAIIGLIVGAIFYLTSYGDEERMEKGKKILVASIIGIVIAFASLVIVRQVAGLVAAQ